MTLPAIATACWRGARKMTGGLLSGLPVSAVTGTTMARSAAWHSKHAVSEFDEL